MPIESVAPFENAGALCTYVILSYQRYHPYEGPPGLTKWSDRTIDIHLAGVCGLVTSKLDNSPHDRNATVMNRLRISLYCLLILTALFSPLSRDSSVPWEHVCVACFMLLGIFSQV